MSHELVQPSARIHSLSRRIVWQFCLFTLLISAVYGLISFILMYTLEDRFIEQQLQQEAAYLTEQFRHTGQWPQPRRSTMQLHFSHATLPEELRQHAIAEPKRKEFFGQQGRHYHLHAVMKTPEVWLLAEVSKDLLVRPIRGGVLQFLVLSGLLVSAIACLIAWLVSRKTTRPLKELAALVDGVAPERLPNNFAQQFPNNEVGIVARALELALSRIASALKREKSFTRDVSHELRTPLAVIKNTLELWRSQQGSGAAHQGQHCTEQEVRERIFEAAVQMEKTVQTLLILAREEHTPEHTSDLHRHTQLMPLVERAILHHSQLLQGKAVEVTLCDSCHVDIRANPDMLKVLLDNLLSNAFHYTEAGEVKIDFRDGQLLISDTGPGIDAAILNNLATPGVKGRRSTGFGFGLSIVQRLCEHQGWKMAVSSENGTTVTVSFPK